MNRIPSLRCVVTGLACLALAFSSLAADKKIVLVAGKPSHGPGDHEFNAGCLLLKKCLDKIPGIKAEVVKDGWPADPKEFDGADAIMLFMDGGGGHPVIQGDHLKIMGDLMKKGVGLGCYHYGVEVPKDKGGPEFLDWIGGFYEDRVSTNPHWVAEIKSLPQHPITRGVKPFAVEDEWYYNIHFRDGMKGVTPLLIATPSDETRQGASSAPRGPYPHIVAASGRDEVLSWAVERPDGGRGFGFTGGHKHKNFGNDDFRKFVLNSLLWLAKAEVPANGTPSSVTEDDLKQNLDPKGQNRAATDERGFGPEAAQADAKKLIVAEGLEATVFASEPMVVNPTDMDIDSKGRIWITEGANYRIWQKWGVLRPEGDRVLTLEDTDGDGKADKSTVFYQGTNINSALGICVLGNKVIVSRSPDVFVLTDTDGDGKADKVDKLFTGISGVDHDHGMHAFIFGPDGKLYFNFGNEGKQLKRPDGSPVLDVEGNAVAAVGKPFRQGMVFRCNLDGSDVEVLGNNFRNNYEVTVDSFGTLWQSDNDDDGNKGVRINYVMEFGNFGYTDELTGAGWGDAWRKGKAKGAPEDDKVSYHWHQYDPGIVPNLLNTGGGSPTGITLYEGELLPQVFRNQMIHCDAGPRVVRGYPVTAEGAGYKATMTNLLTSNDSWFRPSDVCIAPDGAVYVADWNDAGVGGHYMADQQLKSLRGRVYRVAPPGHKSKVPKLNLDTAAGCVEALMSPNQETRYLAWMKLHEMQGKAESELVKVWNGKDARKRARALQLLARIDGKGKKYVETALKDSNADLRITGLRIARSLKMDVIPYVKMLAKDSSAQVRRECAIALRHNASAEAPTLWTTLAEQYDGRDRWYLEALGIGADKQQDKYFGAWLQKVGDNWDTPAGRELVWRSRSTKAPPLLVKLITDKKASATDRDHYMRALDYIQGPEKDAALVQLLGAN
jgi:putative membrane-bound dehydrogenase-like protein